jgi:hypothetical protein
MTVSPLPLYQNVRNTLFLAAGLLIMAFLGERSIARRMPIPPADASL